MQSIPKESVNDLSNTVDALYRKARFENWNTLKGYVLNKIQPLSPNDLRFYFINFNGQIYAIDIQKSPLPRPTGTSFPTITQIFY